MNKLDDVEVKLVRRRDRELILHFKDLPVYIANSIRRACIADVPCMGIDKVYVFENSSVINDQMLAHRVGLIPLSTPVGKYKTREECQCDGECPECTTYLQLKVEAGKENITVKSGDIKGEDPDVHPIHPDIELIKLAPGQKIELTLVARLGRGREHAKWSPVTVAVVRGLPIIRIGDGCDVCSKCVESCPKGILKPEGGQITVEDIYSCTACKLCVEACGKDAIDVDVDEGSSIFYIESVGQMDTLEIVKLAFDEVIRKIDEFISSLDRVEVE